MRQVLRVDWIYLCFFHEYPRPQALIYLSTCLPVCFIGVVVGGSIMALKVIEPLMGAAGAQGNACLPFLLYFPTAR